MEIQTIKIPKVVPNSSLEKVLDNFPSLSEQSVVAVTSKIVSLCEGRCVDKNSIDKLTLIKQEAEAIFKTDENPYGIYLTLKNGILIPSAGIDESNANNTYVLYPLDLWESVKQIWKYLRKKHSIKKLGVIITDSHTTIMRRGVTGIALSWCGLSPLYSYVNKPDLYDHPLKVTQVNVIDALAVSAVFCMGEGNEQTPLAVISNAPRIKFVNRPASAEEKASVIIPKNEDLYAPLLRNLERQ